MPQEWLWYERLLPTESSTYEPGVALWGIYSAVDGAGLLQHGVVWDFFSFCSIFAATTDSFLITGVH